MKFYPTDILAYFSLFEVGVPGENISLNNTDQSPENIKAALRGMLKNTLEEAGASFPVPGLGYDTSAETALRAWFDPLEITLEARARDTLASVVLPHAFFQSWFVNSGKSLLEKALSELLPGNVSLVYTLKNGSGLASSLKEKAQSFPAGGPALIASAEQQTEKDATHKEPDFSAFISGAGNNFALNVLRDNAKGDHRLNPILLRGNSGTGKSMLLRIMATAHQFNATGHPVFLLSGHEFSALFRRRNPDAVRGELKQGYALCLDDVQLLQDDMAAQQELAALIDYYAAHNRPMLFSATRSEPDPLLALSPSLFSRLLMGMALELAEPDLDVKMRYASELMGKHNFPGQRELALMLARRCSSFRQIQGTLSRIAAFHAYSGQLPDERDLDTIFRSSGSAGNMTPEAVLTLVASRCGFTPKDLRGKRRNPELVEARQLAMFMCRELLGESYPALGRIFGNKDHSTVIHAVKKIRKMQVENKDMHNLVTELTLTCRKNLV